MSRELTVVANPPFVLIGDGPSVNVVDVADRVVARTIALLKQDYFELDPEVTDIWVLRDERGYRAVTRRIFHASPSTPFGFYSAPRHTMVMNLATGTGTLTHELVHPFMKRNFPACPSWFDEGLASLYEQPSVRDGHLIGLLNWRLHGLKHSIAGGTLPSLTSVMTLDADHFYHSTSGDNYAASRYLLYYLQEHGLLQNYYRQLRAASRDDPGGVAALERVLGEADLSAFEKRWRAWVLALQVDS